MASTPSTSLMTIIVTVVTDEKNLAELNGVVKMACNIDDTWEQVFSLYVPGVKVSRIHYEIQSNKAKIIARIDTTLRDYLSNLKKNPDSLSVKVVKRTQSQIDQDEANNYHIRADRSEFDDPDYMEMDTTHQKRVPCTGPLLLDTGSDMLMERLNDACWEADGPPVHPNGLITHVNDYLPRSESVIKMHQVNKLTSVIKQRERHPASKNTQVRNSYFPPETATIVRLDESVTFETEPITLENPLSPTASDATTKSSSSTTDEIDEEKNDYDNTPEIMSLDNESEILLLDNESEIMPPDNESEIMPLDEASKILPLDNASEIMPPDNASEIMPPDNASEIMPLDNGSEIILLDNTNEIPPEKLKSAATKADKRQYL